jgi:Domain of unknown function (DUF5666)
MKKLVLPLLLTASVLSFAQIPAANTQAAPPQRQQPAQEQQRPRGEGRRPGLGRGIGGAIQSVTADTIKLTTRDGGTATVKITADTRFMRAGQAAKLSDFKVGDRIMVRGESTGENTWKAEMVGTPPMGGPGGGQGGQGGPNMERMREGLGKEFIAGEVKSIEGTKLTVHGPDGKDYTAEVDENTSFRRGRESITFPDIKVGDRIMGRGKLNSAGVFVPETLNVGGVFRGENGDRGLGDPVRPARPTPPQPPAPPKQ